LLSFLAFWLLYKQCGAQPSIQWPLYSPGASSFMAQPRCIGSARLAEEEDGYRGIVPFNVRSKPRGNVTGVFVCCPCKMRVA
jgi:hypothetical protein